MPSPIPKRLLPDDVLVRPLDTASRRGGEFLEPVAMRHARLDRNVASGMHGAPYQLQQATVALMFVDAANTDGALEVAPGSKVSGDGGESWYTVEAVHAFSAFGGVHHWELELRR